MLQRDKRHKELYLMCAAISRECYMSAHGWTFPTSYKWGECENIFCFQRLVLGSQTSALCFAQCAFFFFFAICWCIFPATCTTVPLPSPSMFSLGSTWLVMWPCLQGAAAVCQVQGYNVTASAVSPSLRQSLSWLGHRQCWRLWNLRLRSRPGKMGPALSQGNKRVLSQKREQQDSRWCHVPFSIIPINGCSVWGACYKALYETKRKCENQYQSFPVYIDIIYVVLSLSTKADEKWEFIITGSCRLDLGTGWTWALLLSNFIKKWTPSILKMPYAKLIMCYLQSECYLPPWRCSGHGEYPMWMGCFLHDSPAPENICIV